MTDSGPGRASLAALLMAVLLAAIFFGGLSFAAAAQDDYAYVAGLGFCGFALLIAVRYFGRFLP
ncbi:MAG: hypothetical protein OHK0024_11190 [Thalassobaculales bacterium]